MIDTDKYKGCRTKAWRDAWNKPYEELVSAQLRMHEQGPNECTQADLELLADAPLLLDFIVWVKNTHPHYYHKLTQAYQGAMSAKNNR
jgi:hypothetical protein